GPGALARDHHRSARVAWLAAGEPGAAEIPRRRRRGQAASRGERRYHGPTRPAGWSPAPRGGPSARLCCCCGLLEIHVAIAKLTGGRKVAVAIWRARNNPQILGAFECDAGPITAFIDAARAAGHHVTPTHLVGRAVAHALLQVP